MNRYSPRRRVALRFTACLLLSAGGPARAEITAETVRAAFGGSDGVLVLRDCADGTERVFGSGETADTAFGPCSTFKIWNSLIGLEEGMVGKPDETLWKWDGEMRDFPGWNEDQTWRSAFAVSCVPAFQELARKIGPERMQSWLEKLDYGNKDQCGRPDAFWLPRAGQGTIMITPREQARMICRMLNAQLPVRSDSVAQLTEVMKLGATERGALHGKTGSGLRGAADGPSSDADFDMGWLVGFVESGGRKQAYACLVLGPGLRGKDARRATEEILRAGGWW
jgi:beta-lactamase class D